MKTIEGIKNALLLTPEEAAGIGVLDPLLVKRGEQVESWRYLFNATPYMVGGTDLVVIGENNKKFLFFVKRECLPEVERLRKELYEFLESHGYEEAFLRWESWFLSGGAGCDFDDVVCIDGDRRTAGGVEVGEIVQAMEDYQRIVQSRLYRFLEKKARENIPPNKDSAQFIRDTADKIEMAQHVVFTLRGRH